MAHEPPSSPTAPGHDTSALRETTAKLSDNFPQAALDYHRFAPAGKIKVVATKPMVTQRDLALAYSPGVAYACEAIVEDPKAASQLTARGNLVAVITNGTAVLGLGDIGPLTGLPASTCSTSS